MSELLVTVHAVLRWVLLAAGAAATAKALVAWRSGSGWGRLDAGLVRAFAVALDVQWTLGLVLYAGVSMFGGRAVASEGLEVLRSPELRFIAVVHPLLATAALVLGHLAVVRARTLAEAPARHRAAAACCGAAVALLVVAVR